MPRCKSVLTDTHKSCTRCGLMKEHSEFGMNRAGLGSLMPACKKCMTDRYRSHAGRVIHSRYRIKSRYGITLEEMAQMFNNQEGLCCVCSQPMCLCINEHLEKKCPTRASVDHDHKTGLVRGLLHRDCNGAIGLLRDSPTYMRNAAQYLEIEHVR